MPNTIRSHSLKVTMFGWAAKGGMDLPSRRILGHHLGPGAKAAEIYGRDSISSAIRKMCRVLTARDLEGSPTLQIKIIMCSLKMTLQIVTPRWQLLTYLKHPEEDRDFGQRKAINHAAFVDPRPCHEEVPKGFVTCRHGESGVQHLRS